MDTLQVLMSLRSTTRSGEKKQNTLTKQAEWNFLPLLVVFTYRSRLQFSLKCKDSLLYFMNRIFRPLQTTLSQLQYDGKKSYSTVYVKLYFSSCKENRAIAKQLVLMFRAPNNVGAVFFYLLFCLFVFTFRPPLLYNYWFFEFLLKVIRT